jgi:hypothetical protein
MKKEAEIKIIEQIEILINKLIKQDTYFRDDLKHHNFDEEDFNVMVNNIRNDFPISHQTTFRKTIEKALDVYKQRLKMAHIEAIIHRANNKSMHYTIEDLEVSNKALKHSRDLAMEAALHMVYAESPEERESHQNRLLEIFPIEKVIMLKAQKGWPLTEKEQKLIKSALRERS